MPPVGALPSFAKPRVRAGLGAPAPFVEVTETLGGTLKGKVQEYVFSRGFKPALLNQLVASKAGKVADAIPDSGSSFAGTAAVNDPLTFWLNHAMYDPLLANWRYDVGWPAPFEVSVIVGCGGGVVSGAESIVKFAH